ncbi:MAG: hypothetical protein ABFS02_02340 [Pseudomonadota bacterium]
MTTIHNLGFPRIGARRELKQALESYWKGESGRKDVHDTGRMLRARPWRLQQAQSLDLVPAPGDSSFFDQVLDMTCTLGCIPERFGVVDGEVDLDTYFRMASSPRPAK